MQQNNVSILSPAIEPDEPSKPRVALNILASIVLGTMLGFGTALGLEKLDRLVRAPEDLAAFEHIPVLSVLQPKPRRYTLREYAAMVKKWIYLRRHNRSARAALAEGR